MTSALVPPAGPARVLAVAQLTNSVGDGAYYVTSALYFTRVIGLSPAQVGLGLTISWAAGFLAATPLGHLADRHGPRATSILLALTTSACVGSFLFARSFPAFTGVACLYASSQCGLTAARQALLAGLVTATERTRIRAYLQSSTNAGLAVGAALGGVALRVDTPAAYLAVFGMDVLAFLAAAAVLRRAPHVPPAPVSSGREPKLAVLRDAPYAVVSFLNMLMLLHIPLIGLAIPLWIVERTQAPAWLVSALLVLNTLSVVAFGVHIARRVTGTVTATRSVRRAGLVLLASCAVFAVSSACGSPWVAAAVLLVAAGVQTLGEMMQNAGGWEIGFALAPAGKQGQYQGFFASGFAVARMLGPLLLTTLVLSWGPLGWLLLGVVFAAAGIAMGPATRWAERTRRAGELVTS
ncbi:MFS transporter [Amycolatopsis minnesotensis]|uniref:MFS transporter n=1 Tax=Amycolatopsis minnesotensis TaxID=337894 RepID=UPI0031CE1A41